MAKTKTPKIDMAQLQEQLQRQFTNLDTKDPSLWPILPRILLCVFIAAAVAVALWYVKLTDYQARAGGRARQRAYSARRLQEKTAKGRESRFVEEAAGAGSAVRFADGKTTAQQGGNVCVALGYQPSWLGAEPPI
jgi:hypothetical protein